MPDTKVTNANTLQLTLPLRVAYRSPAFSPSFRAAEGAVQQIQVDVSQSAVFQRFVDSRFDSIIGRRVVAKLRCEEDCRSWKPCLRQEGSNGCPNFFLIVVPGGRVLRTGSSKLPDVTNTRIDALCGGIQSIESVDA